MENIPVSAVWLDLMINCLVEALVMFTGRVQGFCNRKGEEIFSMTESRLRKPDILSKALTGSVIFFLWKQSSVFDFDFL